MYGNKRVDAADKRMLVRRILVYGAAFFLLCTLQCSFFSRLKPFGAVPDITLGAMCGILMLDNKRAAAVCAVCAGYFIDALGAVPPSFSPLFYLLCVVILGAISDKIMQSFLSYAVLLVPTVLLRAAFTFVNMWIYMKAFPAISVLWTVLLPEMLSTFVFCLPVYFVIKLCVLPIEAKGHFKF